MRPILRLFAVLVLVAFGLAPTAACARQVGIGKGGHVVGPPTTGGGGTGTTGGGTGTSGNTNTGKNGNNNNNNTGNNTNNTTTPPPNAYDLDPAFQPGAAGFIKEIKWSDADINKARKTFKPYVVYVYDNTMKPNRPAEKLEKDVFGLWTNTKWVADKDVKEALKDLLCVMVPTNSTTWPAALTQFGRGGAAVLVLTCDDHFARCTNRAELLSNTKDANARNPVVVEKFKANPLPDWVAPGAPKPAGDKPAPPKTQDPTRAGG